jgi:hypothetical protein
VKVVEGVGFSVWRLGFEYGLGFRTLDPKPSRLVRPSMTRFRTCLNGKGGMGGGGWGRGGEEDGGQGL